MIKPNMIRITPATIAIIAFIMEDPGALIHRARLGLKNAPMPKSVTINPTMRRMMFVIPMLSISVLLLFHTPAFLPHRP